MAAIAHSRSRPAFITWAFSLFLIVLLRTAWVGDDAYFTFRTIDNFVNGHGLRWNAAERVQAYTHPLWMALVTPFYWVSGEPFFTSIAISMALTLVTVWLLIRLAPSLWTAAIGLSVLLLSAAFVDYSTSGLENALTNVLVVLFFGRYLSGRGGAMAPALLVTLVMLNRVDLGLLVLPAFALMLPPQSRRREYRLVAVGFLPLVAWELFSIVYYGFPFPNTAYAKLMHGVPKGELFQQGLIYLLDSIQRDPITLLVIAGGSMWALVLNPARTRAIAVGVIAYTAYVVYVGGDFMSGRMLEAPLVAAVVILIAADVAALVEPKWVLLLPVLLLGLNSPASVFRRQPLGSGEPPAPSGVVDERAYYFRTSGLINYTRDDVTFPGGNYAVNGRQTRDGSVPVIASGNNGFVGYYSGPAIYIVDTQGLGDPLLARLPATRPWRPGHFNRVVPTGYLETHQAGMNQIADAALAGYYDRLSIIVRDPLWSRKRLTTILWMNLGRYDYMLDARGVPNGAP